VHERECRHHHAAGERRERRRTAQHFGRHRRIEHAESGTAEPFRHQEARQAKLDQGFPQPGIEAVAGFGVVSQRLDRHAIRQ